VARRAAPGVCPYYGSRKVAAQTVYFGALAAFTLLTA
jgi:hypothetical protein